MRLNSTSFTHSSTAMFGVAVFGNAAVRVVSYAAPDLPGHQAAPAPHVVQIQTMHNGRQRASRSGHGSPAPTGAASGSSDHFRHGGPVSEHRIEDRETTTAVLAWPTPDGTSTGATQPPLEASAPEETPQTEPTAADDAVDRHDAHSDADRAE
jgi:hypothetical protein